MNLVVEVETLAVREGIRMLEDMNIRGNIVVRTGSLATVELLRASKIRNRTVSNRTKRIAQMWGKDKKIGVVWVMKERRQVTRWLMPVQQKKKRQCRARNRGFVETGENQKRPGREYFEKMASRVGC